MGTFLSKNPYKSTPMELFHFTRNFLNHYMDKFFLVVGVTKVEVDYVFRPPPNILGFWFKRMSENLVILFFF